MNTKNEPWSETLFSFSNNEILFSHEFYPSSCIGRAIEAFHQIAEIEVNEQSGEKTRIIVRPIDAGEDLSKISSEFLNYLLDLAILEKLDS